ncbi:MAG TPA: hypothetical protein VF316_13295, partial [Polyangiaceae bacterium]
MRSTWHASCLAIALLGACGGAAPTPVATRAPPTPLASASEARPTPPPRLALLAEEPADEAERARPLDEPLLPLDRAFEAVELPPDVQAVLGIGPLDALELWLVADGKIAPRETTNVFDGQYENDDRLVVLRWDGARFARQGAPDCAYIPKGGRVLDALPESARRAPHDGSITIPLAPVYDGSFRIVGGEVFLRAMLWVGDASPHPTIEARLGREAKWSCVGIGREYRPEQSLVLGASEARVDAEYRDPMDPTEVHRRLTIEGTRSPLPPAATVADIPVRLAGRQPHALWLWEPGNVWAGNGVAWVSRPLPRGSVLDLWVDDAGAAWALASADARATEGELVYRFDLDAGAWRPFPVPAAFGAKLVRGSGARDVWLLGERSIYHFNGRELGRGDAPLSLRDA